MLLHPRLFSFVYNCLLVSHCLLTLIQCVFVLIDHCLLVFNRLINGVFFFFAVSATCCFDRQLLVSLLLVAVFSNGLLRCLCSFHCWLFCRTVFRCFVALVLLPVLLSPIPATLLRLKYLTLHLPNFSFCFPHFLLFLL